MPMNPTKASGNAKPGGKQHRFGFGWLSGRIEENRWCGSTHPECSKLLSVGTKAPNVESEEQV